MDQRSINRSFYYHRYRRRPEKYQIQQWDLQKPKRRHLQLPFANNIRTSPSPKSWGIYSIDKKCVTRSDLRISVTPLLSKSERRNWNSLFGKPASRFSAVFRSLSGGTLQVYFTVQSDEMRFKFPCIHKSRVINTSPLVSFSGLWMTWLSELRGVWGGGMTSR